jgi:hypothetical protein
LLSAELVVHAVLLTIAYFFCDCNSTCRTVTCFFVETCPLKHYLISVFILFIAHRAVLSLQIVRSCDGADVVKASLMKYRQQMSYWSRMFHADEWFCGVNSEQERAEG